MSLWTSAQARRLRNYASNPLTITGVIIATVSGILILLFLIAALSVGFHNPYLGIVAFVILPFALLLALILIPLGMWRRRRRLIRSGASDEELAAFPRLDFNDPAARRVVAIVLALTVVNGLLFSMSTYFATEHMDTVDFCGETCHTVMQPEFTAYQNSPHSRVLCIQCHIGPGASWFVRSKIDGLRQVWHTAWGTYERPIQTPIHNLRPSRDTCEQCHWPAKHHGDKLKVFAHFDGDEHNTASYTAMLLKTGGGALDLGRHGGIHWWHIYSDNRIRYVAGDERRQEIVWVELTTPDGKVRTYTRKDGPELTPEVIAQQARIMDCVDCHNRPTHSFPTPDRALDDLLQARPDLRQLPYFKREANRAISAHYSSHDAAVSSVRSGLFDFYAAQYPVLADKSAKLVAEGADEAARICSRIVFPEMKTDWTTHPNNIGHEQSPGCWRCHDDEMTTPDGQHTIPQDCDTCHVFVAEDEPTPPTMASVITAG